MKQSFTCITAIAMAAAVMSCTGTLDIETAAPVEAQSSTILFETALETLGDFLAEQYGATRSVSDIKIDSMFELGASGPASSTKAAADSTLLYAVNLSGGGFALLSADTRIPDDIIAYSESGSIAMDDFVSAFGESLPSDGDDTSAEEFRALVESGALAADCGRTMLRSCLTFAENCIKDDSTPDCAVSKSYWRTTSSVPMLMSTAWSQEGRLNMFNAKCPRVGKGKKYLAPAGCVCIALSQIVAYHEYGVETDYEAIKKLSSYERTWEIGDEYSRDQLSTFTAYIGKLCDTKYFRFCNQSYGFAWPSNAKKCLQKLGYKNVELKYRYDEQRIMESLDNSCPVFISALEHLWSGHAWVIDGYIRREYVSPANTVSRKQTLVHCNWGWGGAGNGWYASRIFSTDSPVIDDALFQNTTDSRFWYGFNIITYQDPHQYK